MPPPPYTRFEVVDGVAVITIENPPVNALGPGVLEAIEVSIARGVALPEVTALVLVGAGTTFVAGADINIFAALRTREQALDQIGIMHARLRRIEDASKPIVAAIHGHALGGGLELAMACHYRVAVTDAKLGQPEVLLGLIPGAGGTQRLPRLCGPAMALDLCTTGRPVAAPNALAAGILDRVVEGERQGLVASAAAFARDRARAGDIRRTRDLSDKLADVDAALRACEERRAALDLTAIEPAPRAAVNAIEAACMLPFDAGSALERELFADCALSDASRALVHLFFAEREAARVPAVPKDTPARDIRRAAVLGAGTRGVGLAIAYANAGIPVLLKDGDRAALDRGLQTVRRHYQSAVSKNRMTPDALEHTMAIITSTTSVEALGAVDIVTEAVPEDRALKSSVFELLGRETRAECLLASSTSTLDIDELARASGRPASVIGHYFARPAHETTLVEIARGRETSPEAIATSLKLAKRLGKIGVVIGHCVGSLASRILASGVREANLLLDEGAPAPQIDRAMTRFGMPAGLFALAATEAAGGTIAESAIVNRITTAMADEGGRALKDGCATRSGDIDIICCYGFGFPRARGGPMHYADSRRQALSG